MDGAKMDAFASSQSIPGTEWGKLIVYTISRAGHTELCTHFCTHVCMYVFPSGSKGSAGMHVFANPSLIP